MNNNFLQVKSYAFSIRIVRACQYLQKEKKETVLCKQLLRSGTSVGANTEELLGSQSEKDFKAKLHIIYKEARETHYWIRLLKDTGYLEEHIAVSLLDDCEEILKISGATISTLRKKMPSEDKLVEREKMTS